MIGRKSDTLFDFLVVDASNLMFLSLPGGDPEHAFGPGDIMVKLSMLRQFYGHPDLHICWEGSHNFRHTLYPAYKGNREPTDMTKAVRRQGGILRELLKSTSVHQHHCFGGEGDDVMATVAGRLAPHGRVGIFSTDRDLWQLVEPNVSIVVPQRYDKELDRVAPDLIIGPDEVAAHFGLDMELVPDFKGLAGDAGDNIPGVPGIGPKLAKSYILQHGDLEGVIAAVQDYDIERRQDEEGVWVESQKAHRERMASHLGMTHTKAKKIRAHVEQAYLSRELGRIKRDIDLMHYASHPLASGYELINFLFTSGQLSAAQQRITNLVYERKIQNV